MDMGYIEQEKTQYSVSGSTEPDDVHSRALRKKNRKNNRGWLVKARFLGTWVKWKYVPRNGLVFIHILNGISVGVFGGVPTSIRLTQFYTKSLGTTRPWVSQSCARLTVQTRSCAHEFSKEIKKD